MSMETRTVKLLKALLNTLPQVMPEACWRAQGGKDFEDPKKHLIVSNITRPSDTLRQVASTH